jgi:heme O synthase-like polyprenyltransferase
VVCVDNASDRGILYGRASNAFNQVIEKDLDALMDRTKNPVPTEECLLFSIGCRERTYYSRDCLLYMINPKTAIVCDSIFLYTSVYTPLKRSHHYPFLWVLFRELFRLC